MAAIYTPWANQGAEYAPEDNSAAVQYQEGQDGAQEPDAAEDAAEQNIVSEALSIINEQQRLISTLTAQLATAGLPANE